MSTRGVNFSATIASGQSLSDAVDLAFWKISGVKMPSAWTAAVLSFQGSLDGVNFCDLYNEDGSEMTFAAAADQIVMPLNPERLRAIGWLKIRSGTGSVPVAQGADRTLTIIGLS